MLSNTTEQQQQQQPIEQQHADEHIIYHDTDLQEQEPIRRIVCMAIDQSGYSEYAFNWAIQNFFDKTHDLVVLLNVRPIPTVPGPFGTTYMDFSDYLRTMEDQNRKESHSLLHYYANFLKTSGFSVKAIAMRGDPRDEIIRKLKELGADTLVVGSRGLGMMKRMLLGSLSDYCLHHCECPVVVVKHPKPDTVPQYGKHYLQMTHGASASVDSETRHAELTTNQPQHPLKKVQPLSEQMPLSGTQTGPVVPSSLS